MAKIKLPFEIDQNRAVQKSGTTVISKGYIILEEDKTFAEQVTTEDALYEIRYNYDLGGKTITLKSGCVLKFNGGKLDNGTINGVNSVIDAPNMQVFGDSLSLVGTWGMHELPVEWFGGKKGDDSVDNGAIINRALAVGNSVTLPVTLGDGNYYSSSVIEMKGGMSLFGKGPNRTLITSTAETAVYIHGNNNSLKEVRLMAPASLNRTTNGLKLGDNSASEEANKVKCTYGEIEGVDARQFNIGIDLQWQWDNQIFRIVSYNNNIGVRTGSTTPYLIKANIEGNRQWGVYATDGQSGFKAIDAIIEGNYRGIYCGGTSLTLINVYLESNTGRTLADTDKSSWVYDETNKTLTDKNGYSWGAVLNYTNGGVDYYKDIDGGHIIAGTNSKLLFATLIDCTIANTASDNNDIIFDQCDNLNILGSTSIMSLKTTENCHVGILSGKKTITNVTYQASSQSKSLSPFLSITPIFVNEMTNLNSGNHHYFFGTKKIDLYTGGCNLTTDGNSFVVSRDSGTYRNAWMLWKIDANSIFDDDLTMVMEYRFESSDGVEISQDVALLDENQNLLKQYASGSRLDKHGGVDNQRVRLMGTIPLEEIKTYLESHSAMYIRISVRVLTESQDKSYDTTEGYRFLVYGAHFFYGKSYEYNGVNTYGTKEIEMVNMLKARNGLIVPNSIGYDESYAWNNNVFASYDENAGQLRPSQRGSYLGSGKSLSQIKAMADASKVAGLCMFDTTNKKPVWWTGSAWVDATGTEV